MSYLDKASLKIVGSRPIRPDGVDKVTGRANFGADMVMPGMLWGRIKRSPHAHARIVSIDTAKAAALPGVKAVITRADFPDLPPDKAQIGAAPHNLIDLSLNCMAKGKVLYEGHAVAAVAATSPAIAEEALDLIEVEYQVLPHVMEVEAAMADDAPLLHDNIFTAGVEPKPTKPSNISKVVRFAKGDVEAGFKEADVILERRYTTKPVHQGYIEPHACLVSVGADGQTTIWSSSQGQFMVRAYTARICGGDIANIRAIPAEIGGGFGGKTIIYLEPLGLHAVEEIRPSGQDRDEPRGGVPRHRADLGRGRRRQARRQEGRPHHRRTDRAQIPVGRVSGVAGAAGLHLLARGVRPAECADHRLRRAVQPAQGRRLPRAGSADRFLRRRERDGRIGARAAHRPAEAARDQRRQGRHQGGARADLQQHRLPADAANRARQRTPEDEARPEPGPRHRLRLLAQRRRRIERGLPRQRGRHRHRDRGPPGYRRLARLDGDDGRRGAGRAVRECPSGGRRYDGDRLQRLDRRQPRHLRRRHGGDEAAEKVATS